jgi:hypothetical protein
MKGRASAFNHDLLNGDTSEVTDMKGSVAFNQNLSSGDTSEVTDMKGSVAFNQNLSSGDASKVTDLKGSVAAFFAGRPFDLCRPTFLDRYFVTSECPSRIGWQHFAGRPF